ncbi:MAG TPA: stage II sporulation protein M, partial [Micromonosporaceae bacterium]
HGAEWNRLQVLSTRRRSKLTATEVDELVLLYRRTATHLSVVRSRSADPTLVAWLSRLVLQARAAVAAPSGFSVSAIGRFLTVSFPAEIVRSWRWWVGVAAGFIALSGVLISMVAADQDIAFTFMSPAEIDDLVNKEFEAYYSTYAPQNFAALVWTNNAFVSAICLAGGVLILPTLYMLWQNAFNLGLVGGVMVGNGRSDVFFGLILVHGLLELTCIFIAAGVGLRVGWSWIAPGPTRTRAQALAESARSAMVVALGLCLPLFVSGLVEAFVTPLPLPIAFRLTVGTLVWLAFLVYVFGAGIRAVRRGESADVEAHERDALAPTV